MNLDTVLRHFYNIENPTLKKLEGYESTNYQLTVNNQSRLLKIYEDNKSAREWVMAENEVLDHLTSNDQSLYPNPIVNIKNETLTFEGGLIYRMLTFLEGDLLSQVEHTQELFESFGYFLGNMDRQLLSFDHAIIKARQISRDLQHLFLNKQYLVDIEDISDRKIVEYFFLQYEQTVIPHLYSLRKSVIHNDANDNNILVKEGEVSGIIDFGDMVHGPLINELAIAITYAIMEKGNPLEWAIPILKGYHEALALESKEVELLYYLIAARLCTSVCHSAHAKKKGKNTEYILISEKPAWNLLKLWLTVNPTLAAQRFKEALNIDFTSVRTAEDILIKRKDAMGHGLSTSYTHPIHMARAAFQYMYDTRGNTYLDAYNNIPHVGHEHPRVVEAGIRQMAKLNTNTRYLYDQLHEYAELLLSKFPSSLNKVYFVNSGSAASDLAIRMAMNYTERNGMMVMEHGYHGNTQIGIQISHYKYNHKGGKGENEAVIEAPLPDVYRGPYKDDTAHLSYAEEALIRVDNAKHSIAAFIAEPIVGCGGQVPLVKGYLSKMYPEIRKRGGLCISDEVQTGFGRLGTHFWGFEYHGVVPDMVVLGKPMGNGHPIGAVVTTESISKAFDNGMEFFSSFGGNPVSCAIGKAVLEVIDEEGLQENARVVGDHFISSLKTLQKEIPVIGDVRGSGLFLGVEFVKDLNTLEPHTELANHIKNEMRNRHILVSTDGPYDNVIKMKPPLCFSKENVDQVVGEIGRVLNEIKY